MKVSVTDKHRSGIAAQFAKAIGAVRKGRFYYIPESKGGGYITGFSWEQNELRMAVRDYYLKEEVLLERTNVLDEGEESVIFLIGGIFPSLATAAAQPVNEQANVIICMQTVSSVLVMPPDTIFKSIAIATARPYLQRLLGKADHPVVASILEGKENFVYETGVSAAMVKVASEIVQPAVPERLESHYCKLKCEELLCYIFGMLLQREAAPTSSMHMEDIKAIYGVKLRLQSGLDEPPNIAALAVEAGMSEPKMRKLFKQTFGKGVFEYYQSMRMQEAARLIREKRLSVSEVGYALGFTNLSHFSRVFEQHIGMKPKKYSLSS